jgi:hypothetical protein
VLDHRELGLRFATRHAVPDSGDGLEHTNRALLIRRHVVFAKHVAERTFHENPDVGRVGKCEPAWHDADDPVLFVVDEQRSTDDVGRGVESLDPDRVAEHDGRRRRLEQVLLLEVASQKRLPSKRLKEPPRHGPRCDGKRLAGGAGDAWPMRRAKRRHGVERPSAFGPVLKIRKRYLDEVLRSIGIGLPEHDKRSGNRHPVRAEDGCVSEGERRRRRPNARREARDRNQRRNRLLEKEAKAVPDRRRHLGPF